MKKIIFIVGGIILVVILWRGMWAYQQMKADEASVVPIPALVKTSSTPTQTQSVLFQPTTTTKQVATQETQHATKSIPTSLHTLARTPTSTSSQSLIPVKIISAIEDCRIYTYQDKFYFGGGDKRCLNKIMIQGVYFVAKNQVTGIKSYWQSSMLDIFMQIKNFYEGQFNNKTNITISTPIIIYGDKNIEEYDQFAIEREIRQKVQINSTNNFVVLMFYPIQGENDKRATGLYGGGPIVENSSSAMNSWFWLDPESLGTVTTKVGTDYSGYIGSAHEFGHALSIPHPWDEEVNKDSKGNVLNQDYGNDEIGSLMSYTASRGPLIPNSFIRTQVKKKMVVSE
ncbi:MAG: hypothetical protein AAB497_01315 [Patescibacteria group bacterium]|mgnify:CR=1 FL=1